MKKSFKQKGRKSFEKAADAQLLFAFDLFIKEITITHKLQLRSYPFVFETISAKQSKM